MGTVSASRLKCEPVPIVCDRLASVAYDNSVRASLSVSESLRVFVKYSHLSADSERNREPLRASEPVGEHTFAQTHVRMFHNTEPFHNTERTRVRSELFETQTTRRRAACGSLKDYSK